MGTRNYEIHILQDYLVSIGKLWKSFTYLLYVKGYDPIS